MEKTIKHGFPYIIAAQAQKHVMHNEALRSLDALIQIGAKSRSVSAPPESPTEGDGYIVAVDPTGDWSGHVGEYTAFQDGAWAFHAPQAGWLVWLEDEQTILSHNGSSFSTISELIKAEDLDFQNLPALGVKTTADEANPLSVKASGSLFSHDGDSHRLTINKATPQDTASLVFQNNWSGRAEFGLSGSDNFSVKVSADGSDFKTAVMVDNTTGAVQFPNTNIALANAINLYQDAGRMGGNAEGVIAGAFQAPSYLAPYNGATLTGLGKFIQNNDDYGGSSGTLHPSVKSLVDKIRHSSHRRYGLEFWLCEVTTGSGTNASLQIDGQTFNACMFSKQGPTLPALSFQIYLRAVENNIVVRRMSSDQVIEKNGIEQTGHCVIDPTDDWVAINVRWQINPESHFGYSPAFFYVYCANPGDHWEFACPALSPGLVAMNPNQGILPSFNLWPSL